MSNNIMWLVNERLKRRVAIAKYYPGTGWYPICVPDRDAFIERVNDAFEEGDATHNNMLGPVDWKIQYDIAPADKKIDEDFWRDPIREEELRKKREWRRENPELAYQEDMENYRIRNISG